MSVGTDLLAAPFPMLVRNLGVGIAEAQLELDLVSLKIARMMAGYEIDETPGETSETDSSTTDATDAGDSGDTSGNAENPSQKYLVEFSDGKKYSLLELGFTPTFYQFVDTVIELKLSISMSTEHSSTVKRSRTKVSAKGVALPFFAAGSISVSSVSASYANKYQYSAEGSSIMRTKLVPIPAPALLEERIRDMITADKEL